MSRGKKQAHPEPTLLQALHNYNQTEKHKETKEEQRQRVTLTLTVTAVVMASLIILTAIAAALILFLFAMGVFETDYPAREGAVGVVLIAASLAIGALITYGLIRLPMTPITKIINAINRLSSGDYSARISFSDAAMRIYAARKLTDSFNKMAAELGNTEMLRSDFVNNFSHEFKTPIVSISGFAKLLRKGNLTPEQQEEYLAIIEEESLRLATMATNVLSLTKVENQTILTNVTHFNLSEQIRNCVLLLESKWEKKNLDLEIDFDEYEIDANAELLKEVWINLLDNAIKFTEENGTISVSVVFQGNRLTVEIANTGETIPPESLDKIFNKFYQADTSHAAMGNGVGLAVVKKIVSLHNGSVAVNSKGGLTAFTVTLPVKQ